MNIVRLNAWRPVLGAHVVTRLAQQARQVQQLENRYESRAHRDLASAQEKLIMALNEGKDLPRSALDPLLQTLVDHMIDTMDMGLDVAAESVDDLKDRAPTKRLARPPKTKIPRRMEDLRRFWDKVRHKTVSRKDEDLTHRARSIYENTRKSYLDKLESIWERASRDWRSGKTGSKEAVFEAIQKATNSTARRVSTIVETETTYYYNSTREAYYSQSDAVSHYLFLAVRDHATTKWCRSRHGKVFEKGTQLFRENIPPCHWNCRSEIVPLTAFNPRHKLLIDDKSKRATRANIEPLPPGWGKRAA